MKHLLAACCLVLLLSSSRAAMAGLEIQAGPPEAPQAPAGDLGTAFSYQGYLTDGGAPANGSYDFRFRLYDEGGGQVGSEISLSGVSVTQGLFSVALNFGAVFSGEALWLEVDVAPAGSGSWVTLAPRQAVRAVPYALGLRPGTIVEGQTASAVLQARNLATTGVTYGLYGESASTIGYGVYGSASASSGFTYGVVGLSISTTGRGVFGETTAASGSTYGVYGKSASSAGSGVYGHATASSGATRGVYGLSLSTDGYGVYGFASASSGYTYGVYGLSVSTTGRGVFGETTAASGLTYGVYGRSDSTAGYGIFGYATASSGLTYGVHGRSDSTAGYGVYGNVTASSGVTYGVWGQSASSAGSGVHGYASASSGYTYGVYGLSASTHGYGVYGYASASSGFTYGVYGRSVSTAGTGVYGWAYADSGTTFGVVGVSESTAGYGIYGAANAGSGLTYGVFGAVYSTSGYAGYFAGKVHVTGTLTKGGGGFKIDHPLDPANKYLYHSFVESPDMLNLYTGVATLDADGAAWVTLPAWFEALNKDFRYLLTPLGGAMPDLHIAVEVQDNRFQIAGGLPGGRVSWLVTGIRHDPFAEANRIPVEQDKPPEQQGLYLYPELYGQPDSLGVDYAATHLAADNAQAEAPAVTPE